MSKVLIVEDDADILRLEKDYLEANGFETITSLDGKDGLNKAISYNFDLVLLDVMLPGLNGFEICKRIREEKNTPIIFVTAKKEELDKIAGLEYGADDYIVKPFSPRELAARVKAHINRYQTLTNAKSSDDDLTVDNLKMVKSSGQVFIGDEELFLTKKEFDVLFILAGQPNAVFSKNDIFESVWGYDSLGDTSTLTVHINRLREKLRDADPSCDYIKTVWGRGYKFK